MLSLRSGKLVLPVKSTVSVIFSSHCKPVPRGKKISAQLL
jgi:hypothetical protein